MIISVIFEGKKGHVEQGGNPVSFIGSFLAS